MYVNESTIHDLVELIGHLYSRSRPKFTVHKKNVVKRPNCKMEVNLARALLAASNEDGDLETSG